MAFQKRFEELVESGKKRQTIRPASAFREKLKVGDLVYLRSWIGSAYHSKQKRLGIGRVTEKVEIEWGGFDGFVIDHALREDMARRDGFKSVEDMLAWFHKNHPDSKKMVVIRWDLETTE